MQMIKKLPARVWEWTGTTSATAILGLICALGLIGDLTTNSPLWIVVVNSIGLGAASMRLILRW